jgi:hypothetical protein
MASDFTPSGGPPKAVVNPFSWPESQVTEWSTTEDEREARASALDAGRIHGEHLAELARIKDEAGGSFDGASRTLVGMLHDRGTITSADKGRLMAILDAFRDIPDPTARHQAIETIHLEAVEDATSTPSALAISSVALDDSQRDPTTATVFDNFTDGVWGGKADVWGGLYGTLVLPGVGTLAGTVAATYLMT